MNERAPAPGAGLVLRRADGAVFVGVRTSKARSWPGTLAFPGGAVDVDDHALPLARGAADAPEHAARAAALREALEEAGLVVVCTHDGARAAADAIDALHAALAAGRPLGAALAATGLVLDDRALVPLSTWTTMEGSFAVRRYLLSVDHDDALAWRAPLVGELAACGFRAPAAIAADWQAGRAFLLPPIRDLVLRLADVESSTIVDDVGLARLRGPVAEADRCRRDLSPGVVLLDARTPTLWPATHTNTPVLGGGDVLLVDPATPYDDERARFDALLRTILDGRRVAGIFLTHHHHDHTGDAARLRQVWGCPVYAHALTAAQVDVAVDAVIDDGHVLALPAGPGGPARRFVAVHTPGHARGHLCLWEPDLALLVAGDMVAGTGSILIDPPEGHMNTYLCSLQRLLALAPRALIPSHGPLLVDGVARLQQQLDHRRARHEAVAHAIAAGHATVDDVLAAVYGVDTPPAMWAFAARSVVAIAQALVEDGRVVEDDGRYVSRS
ncbi:MAG: MBL fold metallo-hydrolase [Deltaproteobacteria bacterium]|nr:MBL fold metallo-hydrolase [Deltaproteobacteria bacterium]